MQISPPFAFCSPEHQSGAHSGGPGHTAQGGRQSTGHYDPPPSPYPPPIPTPRLCVGAEAAGDRWGAPVCLRAEGERWVQGWEPMAAGTARKEGGGRWEDATPPPVYLDAPGGRAALGAEATAGRMGCGREERQRRAGRGQDVLSHAAPARRAERALPPSPPAARLPQPQPKHPVCGARPAPAHALHAPRPSGGMPPTSRSPKSGSAPSRKGKARVTRSWPEVGTRSHVEAAAKSSTVWRASSSG